MKKPNISSIVEGTGSFISGAYKKTKNAAVKVIDQNSDGKIDLKDFSEMANSAGRAMKNSATSMRESWDEKSREAEKRNLQPIFAEDVDSADFNLPKLIRICDRDKKRTESEICKGSVGYFTDQKELRLVNIFRENIDLYNVTLIPDGSYEFYYADQSDRDRYIALDEYFSYLKIARINELQKIAQDLGAKHFKVTYKEEKKESSSRLIKGSGSVLKINSTGEFEKNKNEYASVEIAAEMTCAGHEPIRPKLNYLAKDTSIQSLVELRFDTKAPITHQKYMLKLSNSSGIKEKDAMKIDAVLKLFKCSGNVSVVSEAQNEARRYLEYEIDF